MWTRSRAWATREIIGIARNSYALTQRATTTHRHMINTQQMWIVFQSETHSCRLNHRRTIFVIWSVETKEWMTINSNTQSILRLLIFCCRNSESNSQRSSVLCLIEWRGRFKWNKAGLLASCEKWTSNHDWRMSISFSAFLMQKLRWDLEDLCRRLLLFPGRT